MHDPGNVRSVPSADPSCPDAGKENGSSPRCRVAMGALLGTAYRGEVEVLLHNRLRIVVLLFLLPALVYLILNLLESDRALERGRVIFVLHSLLVLITAGLAVYLWRHARLRLSRLRVVEAILFSSTVIFFAWLQYHEFRQNYLFQIARTGRESELLRLASVSSTLRWFFAIVIYGVFVPNTWRRCALVVAGMALIPLLLTPIAAYLHHRLDHALVNALGDMAVLLLTGVAVAIFGSYRLQSLEAQAFEARQLGQYRLKQRLGAGGMGEVYLAEHLLLRRPCAIKLIRPEQAGDPTTLSRFEREVQSMAQLTHWNTVEVFDYGHADDGTFYYVMEYLAGPNLEQLVAHYGPLPSGRVIHFLRQICAALREAHGIGLLHRDVKPSNVLVCERGGLHDVAKLLDFGLVQGLRLDTVVAARRDAGDHRLTIQGSILGSPPYMSPEQAAGKDGLDVRSDLYSLGAVAYYLLTGQPPFVRETPMLVLMAHAYDTPVAPSVLCPGIDADLEAVVLRCLAKDPSQRFADADSLDRALAACAAAGSWSAEEAAAWWQEHPHHADTATEHTALAPTEHLAASQEG